MAPVLECNVPEGKETSPGRCHSPGMWPGADTQPLQREHDGLCVLWTLKKLCHSVIILFFALCIFLSSISFRVLL